MGRRGESALTGPGLHRHWTGRVRLTALAALGAFGLVHLFHPVLYRAYDAQHYLALHAIAECFSIFAAFTVFAVAWLTSERNQDLRNLFWGGAFLAVGLIDLFHTLSYSGMPLFLTPSSAPKATMFWVIARLLAAATFIAASYMPAQGLRVTPARRWAALALALVAAGTVLLVVTYGLPYLPPMYVEGRGLTGLKVALEYGVIAVQLLAAVRFWRHFTAFGDETSAAITCALVLGTFSELAFTLYVSVYDTYNLLGHVFKVAAYWWVLQGLFAATVKRPYEELDAARTQLRRANLELEAAVERRTRQLEVAVTELKRRNADLLSTQEALRTSDRRLRQSLDELEATVQARTRHVHELMAQLIGTQERERKRMAGEIHDWLAQGLVGPTYQAQLTRRLVADCCPPAVTELERLESCLQQASQDLRRIMDNLHPHLLEDCGLVEAVRQYVADFGRLYGVETSFLCQGEPGDELERSAELAVFRIIQEALNNVAKHAGASRVSVVLDLAPDGLVVEVRDNGVGFATPGGGQRGHYGLAGMRERAASLGGELVVKSVPGVGTTVSLEVPASSMPAMRLRRSTT